MTKKTIASYPKSARRSDSDGANMTIRTISDVFTVLGYQLTYGGSQLSTCGRNGQMQDKKPKGWKDPYLDWCDAHMDLLAKKTLASSAAIFLLPLPTRRSPERVRRPDRGGDLAGVPAVDDAVELEAGVATLVWARSKGMECRRPTSFISAAHAVYWASGAYARLESSGPLCSVIKPIVGASKVS